MSWLAQSLGVALVKQSIGNLLQLDVDDVQITINSACTYDIFVA